MADFASISKQVLFDRNCKNTLVGGNMNMESADMIKYISDWKAGAYANVRSLKLSVADGELNEFFEDILDAFEWTKYPEDTEPKFYRLSLCPLTSQPQVSGNNWKCSI